MGFGETSRVAKGDCLLEEASAEPAPAPSVVDDEPAQMRPAVTKVLAVDRHHPDHPPGLGHRPQAVDGPIEPTDELGETGGDLALEDGAETGDPRIGPCVHVDRSSDQSGPIARLDVDSPQRRLAPPH